MLDYVRKLIKEKGFDAAWKWAMDARTPCGKAKRFGALQEVAHDKMGQTHGGEREEWEEKRDIYRHERRKFERRCEAKREANWPDSMRVGELLYHYPGPHLHFATPDRDKLITVAKICEEKYNLRIGEFPPFDPVECVHTTISKHYQDSSNYWGGRQCSNRGNGCAFDGNDNDGGNDDDYAAYLEIRRRYA